MRVNAKLALLLMALFLTNCSSNYSLFSSNTSNNSLDGDELSLVNLKAINQDKSKAQHSEAGGTTMRSVALHEMALSMGMRAGLYFRAQEINAELLTYNTVLDEVFDFRELILEDRIVPPVLIEAVKTMDAKSLVSLPTTEDSFLLNNNPVGQALANAKVRVERAQNNFTTLRITDRAYKLIRQARFAVTLPSWRDYLQLEYTRPMLPETSILPKDQIEQDVWAKGVEEGWKMGLTQADQIFVQNLMLLRRDYLGMLRYRKLLAMNMVSAPFVAKRQYGVTGDGDEIKINDRVLTITALPSLKVDSKLWRPHLIQEQEQELDNKLTQLGLDKTLKYLPQGSTNNAGKAGASAAGSAGSTGAVGTGFAPNSGVDSSTGSSHIIKSGKGFIDKRELLNK
jgi:defect-in-organelle-trafficking protein DotC